MKALKAKVMTLALGFGAVVGCGSSQDVPPDAAMEDATSDSASSDSAMIHDGGGDVRPAQAASAPISRAMGARRGRIVFDRSKVRASFDSDEGYPEYTWGCHLWVVGDCDYEACANAEPGRTPHFVDAGTLTITNTRTSKKVELPVNRNPPKSSEDLYPSAGWDVLQPQPGDVIEVRAAGSPEVPAFTTMVTVPRDVRVTSPSGTHQFSLSQGLSFTWTANPDLIRLASRISGFGFDGFNPSFAHSTYCVFPGASGATTIPPAAFTRFKCTGFGESYASGVGEAVVTTGGYTITLQWLQPKGEEEIFFSSCKP